MRTKMNHILLYEIDSNAQSILKLSLYGGKMMTPHQ